MQTLFVIDAYNLIYRMFYAVPEMHTRSGEQVNAIFGVAKFLHSLALENPTAHIVVANDVGKSFRADKFEAYKAQRDRMPDNLRSQIEGVFSLFTAAGIPILSEEWYEADDIIGSIAVKCHIDYAQVIIISSDKDLCQFVQDWCVHIYDAMKRKFMKRVDVIEKFGVPPEQVRDYLAIVGDVSDNIPGISGFGPKKAVSLLEQFGTLEKIYESIGVTHENEVFHFDEAQYGASSMTEKQKQGLLDQKENAFLSKYLATIVTDRQVEHFESPSIESAVLRGEYLDILRKYEFRSLVPKNSDAPEEKKIEIATENIDTYESLQEILAIIQKNDKTISVSFSGVDRQIFLAFPGKVYVCDVKVVDVTDLVRYISNPENPVVAYNIKLLLHGLGTINKPLEKNVQGQESLF